jgi:hypothetical protein
MKLIFTILFIATVANGIAQNASNDERMDGKRKNHFKANVSSLLIKNYSVSFERILSTKFSTEISYRFAPYNYLFDNFLGNQITKRASIDIKYLAFQTSNNAITADLRFYPGKKGAGKGYYLAIYGRYSIFDLDHLDYDYISAKNLSYKVPLVCNFNYIAAGVLSGMQFIIKKRLVLDCHLAAIHYGKAHGTLISNKDLSGLNATEKAELETDIEDTFTFNGKNYLQVNVSDNGIRGNISKYVVGFRPGILIGYVF